MISLQNPNVFRMIAETNDNHLILFRKINQIIFAYSLKPERFFSNREGTGRHIHCDDRFLGISSTEKRLAEVKDQSIIIAATRFLRQRSVLIPHTRAIRHIAAPDVQSLSWAIPRMQPDPQADHRGASGSRHVFRSVEQCRADALLTKSGEHIEVRHLGQLTGKWPMGSTGHQGEVACNDPVLLGHEDLATPCLLILPIRLQNRSARRPILGSKARIDRRNICGLHQTYLRHEN